MAGAGAAMTATGEDDALDAAVESVAGSGRRAAVLHTNQGVVQTGDNVRAVVGVPVSLGPPDRVATPSGGFVGLPKPPVRVFVGRDEDLAKLGRLVEAGTGVVAQAVHGLGGVGKSELALQYVARHGDRYPVVWWVSADSPEAIESGLAGLTFRLHPDAQLTATEAEAASWAVGWLQSHPSWLLVLDNVEQREHVEPLLAQLTQGHVLITTRRDVGWEQITDGYLRLEVLTPDAAVDLLTRISGQTDQQTAGVLCEELGYLPLALQQAGAYLQRTRTPMTTYVQRLRQDPGRMLCTVAAGDSAGRAVARVWSVTIDAIGRESPAAVALLQIMACFAPDDLPRDVLTATTEDPAGVDEALGVLASYNMIALTDVTVAVHRLVQAVIIAQMRNQATGAGGEADGDGQQTALLDNALHAACDLLSHAVPAGNPQVEVAGWPRWAALSPHIGALADLCPDQIGGTKLAWLLGRTAVFEETQGHYQIALSHQTRTLKIIEAALGSDHPEVANALDGLAGILRALGRAADVELLQRRALAITEAALRPDHPDVAGRLDNLAISLHDLDRSGEAEPLQRRALAITEATLGPNHPDVAIRLN
ncbi:Tetratricopeptide repeat-containing protein [Micromonospora rhizosphaerae]|uniref:Tetratricopeptide repeat-containing protein n=1 Tax=Micromonospora rhizosphaerae TaxID=568872 RepID=A0A1C6SNN5_9ACTN|nr:tetratricopeptide repeat protein [Micromonospora rhizosphaerae]SCL31068.1 Tetratricopeptide repeat-containing protein [Micromonospora rhizosphaerae]